MVEKSRGLRIYRSYAPGWFLIILDKILGCTKDSLKGKTTEFWWKLKNRLEKSFIHKQSIYCGHTQSKAALDSR